MLLLFDIGGTKTRLAISHDGNTLNKREVLIFPTPSSFTKGIDGIVNFSEKFSFSGKLEAVIGGIGGPLGPKKEKLIDYANKPNLKNWDNKPLKEILSKKLKCPVFLENDASLGGLGEATLGAGKNYPIVAYLTIGTGVGGVRIVNNKIDTNSLGFEPGKQIVDADGSIYPESTPPITLEEIISGLAIKKRTGKSPGDIKDKKFWEDIAYYLAIGLNDTLIHWSPDILILDGSLIKQIPLEHTQEILAKILTTFKKIPQIKKASLGEFSGLYGGLWYFKSIISRK